MAMDVVMVGGGMITHDQLLPSVYQLQRLGVVGDIKICALNTPPLKALADSPDIQGAFPDCSFSPYPDWNDVGPDEKFPGLYEQVIAQQKPRQLVVVAVPDQMHYSVLKVALKHHQHVLCVKPLVLDYQQALEIEHEAYAKGLFIGVEYHKRLDDRSLIARRRWERGEFGEFRFGWAHLIEPWYYRDSNFQNWCTCENTDMFTYIGCHYVDLVTFITGLKPVSVSVYGIADKYPNGNEGYLWTDGRVIFENGGVLSVFNAIGYPNEAPGGNSQGMTLYGQNGLERSTIISHSDQFRGVKHSIASGDKVYHETNPDFMQYVPWSGDGYRPVGYGYRSVEFIVNEAARVESAGDDLAARQKLLDEIDAKGLVATPKNSNYNELVMEAGRKSILNASREVLIDYGQNAGTRFREY
jgi:D-galacturonate reductase